MSDGTWKRPSGSDAPTNTDFWKAEFTQGRQPSGEINARPDNLSADPGNGRLRPRGNAKPDPLGQTMGKGARSNDGKVGATYRITARMPAQMQPSAATQANGRILPATHSRTGSFYVQGVYDDTSA